MRVPIFLTPVVVAVAAAVSLMAMRLAGAGTGSMVVQAVAFALAAVLATVRWPTVSIAGMAPRSAAGVVLLAACALLLAGVEIGGARRWLRIGPMLLHTASLLGALLLLALARAAADRACLVLAGAAVLCFGLGNDGAASLAFALGLGGLLLARQASWKALLPLCLLAWVLVAWGWTRPDTLAPVPYVEGILAHTWTVSPVLGSAAAIVLALVPLPFVLVAGTAGDPASAAELGRRGAAYALAGFWLGLVLAGLAGNYPVPVLGYGASPVIGWGLALGLISSRSA